MTVICAAAAPATAAASTVTVGVDPAGNAGLEYRAAQGESNRVEVVHVNDFTIRVIDLGAVITSGDARARTACPAGRAQMAWPAARTTTLSLADAGTTSSAPASVTTPSRAATQRAAPATTSSGPWRAAT